MLQQSNGSDLFIFFYSLEPVNEPDTAQDQNQTEVVTEKTDVTPKKSSSASCVFNLGINKDKTEEHSGPSEEELNQSPKLEKVTAVVPKESSGEMPKLLQEITSDKDEIEEMDNNNDVKSTADEKKDEDLSVKEAENVDKDTKSCDVADEKQDITVSDSCELLTPTKNVSITHKADGDLLPQEVTPPKSSQCPTDQSVIVTPVIKIKKMSVQDILRYSPSAATDSQFARLDVDSSPKVFPSSQEKGSRFRRHKSEEVRASPRLKRSQGRTSSFDDMVIMETQSEEILSRSPKLKSLAGKQQGLMTSQADLAELAEHFELDGIEPLDDEADVNQAANASGKQSPEVADVKCDDKDQDLKNEGDDLDKEDAKGQEVTSEESMEIIDSQEELIPEGSEQPMDCDTEENSAETDSQSDYVTADESEREEGSSGTEMTKEGTKKSKEKPEFILSTLEELTEPISESIPSETKPKSSVNISLKSGEDEAGSTGVMESKDVALQEANNKDSQGEESAKIDPESSQTSASPEEKKKGRGRPRKAVSPENTQEAKKQKKGRGRPKKTETSQIDDSSANENLDSQSSEDLSGQSCDEKKSIGKKRGRGRPRKIQSDDSSSQDESQEQSSEDSKGEKKGRGRPKKQKDVCNDSSTSSEKVEKSSSEECENAHSDELETSKVDASNKVEVVIASDSSEEDKEIVKETNHKNKENLSMQTMKRSKKGDNEKKGSVSVASKCIEPASAEGNVTQSSTDERSDANIPEADSSHLENSCEDMFGSYNVEVPSEKQMDAPQKDEEEESSVAVVEVKTSNKKKRRSFTKLSRKRHHSPTVWDEDDDVPLAKITHSYLDVESQSSDDAESSPKKTKQAPEIVTRAVTRSSQKESPVPVVGVKQHRKRKSPRFSSLKIKKSPESRIAKKALRRALKSPPKKPLQKSPLKKSSEMLSPARIKANTPISAKKRSPIATRLRAGKLTPTSARRLLAGKGRASPKKLAKREVKSEMDGEEDNEEDDEMNVSGVEERDSSFDDSFDMPLNQYIKQSKSPESKIKDTQQTTDDLIKDVTTTQSNIVDDEKSTNANEQDKCAHHSQEETVSLDKSAPIIKEVEQIDPKVGQSLQSLPQRLQFVAINGRNSPTECNTPPKNTSPVVPHKFSPRSSSSPVEFAMRRGANQGSPRQRASPVTCEIPGVFSPSASPSTGILKRRDSDTPSPSPTNKVRIVIHVI